MAEPVTDTTPFTQPLLLAQPDENVAGTLHMQPNQLTNCTQKRINSRTFMVRPGVPLGGMSNIIAVVNPIKKIGNLLGPNKQRPKVKQKKMFSY